MSAHISDPGAKLLDADVDDFTLNLVSDWIDSLQRSEHLPDDDRLTRFMIQLKSAAHRIELAKKRREREKSRP